MGSRLSVAAARSGWAPAERMPCHCNSTSLPGLCNRTPRRMPPCVCEPGPAAGVPAPEASPPNCTERLKNTSSAPTGPIRPSARTPLLVAVLTTVAVTALSYLLPEEHAATGVGLGFLVATYLTVLRRDDDESVVHCGLSLGGVLERKPLSVRRLGRALAGAMLWAVAIAVVILPPFWLGFWWFNRPDQEFVAAPPPALGADVMGHLLVIALPEEAFYRGYLQTRLDDAWGRHWRLLGARVGPALLVSSALFALGHVATRLHPNRLAVFFPSLLFGWLRARTGAVGPVVLLHALCNLFTAYLARSYGLPE
jgi:membrane protease YdiL (CAAX protease family)